jgi:hypothetical protein
LLSLQAHGVRSQLACLCLRDRTIGWQLGERTGTCRLLQPQRIHDHLFFASETLGVVYGSAGQPALIIVAHGIERWDQSSSRPNDTDGA